MNEIVLRKTIEEVFEIKLKVLAAYQDLEAIAKNADELMQSINNYSFYRLDRNVHDSDERNIDQRCWMYFIRLYNLEKYMLCTEYQKLTDQIHNFDFPVFTIENAHSWVLSLKSMVYESIQKLIEDVFQRITQDTYWTGTGYSNRLKKKRNNNGIDKHFIITTGDHYAIARWSGRPTITDDLEKACYIIDGRELPEITIKTSMQKAKVWESKNDYFKIKIFNNGNTHYWLNDNIREKLNFYGAKRGQLGSNCKIKIFE